MAGWFDFVNGQTLPASRVQDYLMDQSVMVFADAAARTAALPSPTNGMVTYLSSTGNLEVCKQTIWYPVIDTANQAAQLTTRRNNVLNSGFDFWQRGTSFTGAAPYYTADRWQNYRPGAIAGSTYTRQSAGLNGFDYAIRMQRNAGDTNTGYVRLATTFETSQVKSLWGQPLVLSFYARAGANLSSTSNQVAAQIVGGTGTDGSLGGGFTGSTILNSNVSTITTSWARYTLTLSSLTNTYSQLGLVIQFTPTGTAGAADFIEVTGVQLETGSVATPFTRAATTLQGELAACQRYYVRYAGGGAYSGYGSGFTYSSSRADITLQLPVQMRVTPTSIDYANISLTDSTLAPFTVSSLNIDVGYSGNLNVDVVANSSGLTSNRPARLQNNNNAAGYVGLSAEL
jgi:hypothetical protein